MTRDYKPIPCDSCKKEFLQKRTGHRFCSSTCKGVYKYSSNTITTESQYKYISGNWLKYLNRLTFKRRRENGLTADLLMSLLVKQNYKCALTGKELTCILERGVVCQTNASIDRINAGGDYVIENIQLVCRAVNSFRNNVSLNEFISWCNAVTKHNQKESANV